MSENKISNDLLQVEINEINEIKKRKNKFIMIIMMWMV